MCFSWLLCHEFLIAGPQYGPASERHAVISSFAQRAAFVFNRST